MTLLSRVDQSMFMPRRSERHCKLSPGYETNSLTTTALTQVPDRYDTLLPCWQNRGPSEGVGTVRLRCGIAYRRQQTIAVDLYRHDYLILARQRRFGKHHFCIECYHDRRP